MTPTATVSTLAAVARLAAGPLARPAPRPLRPDGDRWKALLRAVVAQRLTGAAVLEHHERRLVLTHEHAELLASRHRAQLVLDVALEQHAIEVIDALEHAGIDVLLLKGPALAHGAYADPALRSFGDVDLLVRAGQIGEAIALIAARGGQRRYAEPRPGIDESVSKGAALVMADGIEVDVHRSLAQGAFGIALDVDALFAHRSTVRIGGRDLPVLSPVDQLLHAAVHAVCGEPTATATTCRDVLVLAHGSTDVPGVVRRAEELGLASILADALAQTEATLPIDPAALGDLHPWSVDRAPSPQERRWLSSYRASPRRSVHLGLGALEAASGRARLRLALALLRPDDRRAAPLRRARRALAGSAR